MIMEDAGVSLDKFKTLASNDVAAIVTAVYEILKFLHEKDWYHGDISLSNVTLKAVTSDDEGFIISLTSGLHRIYLIDVDESGNLSLDPSMVLVEHSKFVTFKNKLYDLAKD